MIQVDYIKVASDLALKVAQLELDNKVLLNMNEQLLEQLKEKENEK